MWDVRYLNSRSMEFGYVGYSGMGGHLMFLEKCTSITSIDRNSKNPGNTVCMRSKIILYVLGSNESSCVFSYHASACLFACFLAILSLNVQLHT